MPRGGKREGAGPKPLPDGHKKVTMSFAVSPEDELWLRSMAGGKRSLSVVLALCIAIARKSKEWPK